MSVRGVIANIRSMVLTSSAAALLGSTSLALVLAAPSMAQSSIASFEIAAGALPQALAQYARQAGVQVTYVPSIAQGKVTGGVSGALSPEQALLRLLEGTGLTGSFVDAGTVAIAQDVPTGGASYDGSIVLEEIDVTAMQAGAGADVPYQTAGSSSHISAEQIERLPPAAPGDLFRSVPGVLATANRAGAKLDVNIRGLQGMNRVGITLDGAMQSLTTYRGYQGAGSRVYVDPELIGGIDITKGPGAGGAAPGAIGGTVAMRTLSADDILLAGNEFGGRVRLSTASGLVDPVITNIPRTDSPSLFENWDNFSGSAAYAINKDGLELVIAGSRRKEGNYFAGTNGPETYTNASGSVVDLSPADPGKEVFNTSQDTTSLLGKVKWSNEEHAAELSYLHYDSHYGENQATNLTYSFTSGGVTTFPNYRETLTDKYHKTVDTVTASYGWSPVDNDLIDLRLRAWGTTMALDDNWDSTIRMFGGEVKNTSRLDTPVGALSFDYGVSASFEQSDATAYSYAPIPSMPSLIFTTIGVNGTRNVATTYANAELKPTEWLTLSGGVRWETFETRDTTPAALAANTYPDLSGSALSPRASVVIEPWQGIQFFGQYEEGTRPPSLYENSNNLGALVPNPNLRAESARNMEVGLNVLQDGLLQPSDSFRFKAAYFHNQYDDYLSRVSIGPYSVQMQNIPQATFSGVEVSASYDAGAYFAELGANYYDSIEFCYASGCGAVNQADYATNHIPPKVTASATLGVRLFEEKLVVGGRATYFGERALPIVTNPATVGGTSSWAPYTLVDAFASYEVNEHMRVDLAIDNVFDAYYVDALNNLAQPGPGRTARLTVTGRF